jgi:hypothetical protein
LFALLSVLLFGGLRFANRSVALGTAVTTRATDIALAEGFIRAQLSTAQPLMRPVGNGQAMVAFDGEPDRLDFVVLPPAYLARGGFHWLHLSRDGAGPRGILTARWQPVAPGEADASAGPATVLLQNVGSASFSYFSVGDSDHSAAWHDHWQDAAGLPDLVSIRITFSDGQVAPELTVALRFAGPIAASR